MWAACFLWENALTCLNIKSHCLCTLMFLGQCGGAAVGIFTSLRNNSGFDVIPLPFPPSDTYFRLFGTLHQELERNGSVSWPELCVPALWLTAACKNILLLLSYSGAAKECDYFMTSDAKFEKLHETIKEDFERYRFFPLIICSVETPVACQVPPSLLQSLTLTHNAPGAQPWLLLFWAHY